MKISIVIPVYNESKNIKSNLAIIKREFDALNLEYEIIVVDDGSTDGTPEALIGFPDIQFFILQKNMGKGVAFRHGVRHATGDKILMMDSDLQISPKEITHFLKTMDFHSAEAVIGNKHHVYGNIHYSTARLIMSRTYNMINKMLFGIYLADSQCGFKLFNRQPLESVLSKLHIGRFAFDIEILVALKENDYRVADAPVTIHRSVKTRAANLPTILNVLWDTWKIWIVKKMGFYKLGD